MALQSRRRIIAFIAMLIVLVGAFILLRPRLWVKNKTAKVIVDGRLSEDVKLYHGSDDRLLFYLKNDPATVFVYLADQGLWQCNADDFLNLKIISISKLASSGCAGGDNRVIFDVQASPQAIGFSRAGHNIVVSWQAAPR